MSPELKRTTSKTSWKIITSYSRRAVAPASSPTKSHQSIAQHQTIIPYVQQRKTLSITTIVRSLLGILSIHSPKISACGWLTVPSFTLSAGQRVTGTLFGHKNGHVSFAVQFDPRVEPVLLLDLATSTCALVKEMASGMVRIALECEKGATRVQLLHEPVWTMYCNGRPRGHAVSRTCSESDWHVLRAVQSVSAGAGVLPAYERRGQVMYMRARFERVVGSRDSEAFYMLNLEGNGGPELSIFLLRI